VAPDASAAGSGAGRQVFLLESVMLMTGAEIRAEAEHDGCANVDDGSII